MDLSIKTAISRVRKDKSYKIKTFSVGLIVTVILILNILQGNCQDNRLYLASFTVFAIIQIISAFLGGYFALNSNLRLIRGFGKLYEFKNYKKIFKTGFKLLPIAILSIVLMFISFFLSKFMHNYAESSAYNSGISSNLIMGLIFLVIFCLFLFSIYIYCGYLAFCIELKLSIFFKLKIISKILKAKSLITLLLKVFLTALTAGILICILTITLIGIILIPFIIAFCYFIICDLNTEFLKNTFVFKLDKK